MEYAETQELRRAIKRFVAKAPFIPSLDPRTKSGYFIEHNRAVCERYLKATIDRLIASQETEPAPRAKLNPEEEKQLRFLGEDFAELFSGITHKVEFRHGLRREIRLMTVNQLRQAARTFRNTVSPKNLAKAQWLDEQAERMAPYAEQHPKLQLGAWLDLVADGITAARK